MHVERVIDADPTSTALVLSGMGAAPLRVATAYVAAVEVGTIRLRRHASRGTEAVILLDPGVDRAAAETFLLSLAAAAEGRAYAA